MKRAWATTGESGGSVHRWVVAFCSEPHPRTSRASHVQCCVCTRHTLPKPVQLGSISTSVQRGRCSQVGAPRSRVLARPVGRVPPLHRRTRTRRMAPAQPTRAAALAELAPKQEVMHNLPLHIYYRSADATLLKVTPSNPIDSVEHAGGTLTDGRRARRWTRRDWRARTTTCTCICCVGRGGLGFALATS